MRKLTKVFSKLRVSKAIDGLTKFTNQKGNDDEDEVRLFYQNIFNTYLKNNSEKLKKLRISNKHPQSYYRELRKKLKLRAKLDEILSFFFTRTHILNS